MTGREILDSKTSITKIYITHLNTHNENSDSLISVTITCFPRGPDSSPAAMLLQGTQLTRLASPHTQDVFSEQFRDIAALRSFSVSRCQEPCLPSISSTSPMPARSEAIQSARNQIWKVHLEPTSHYMISSPSVASVVVSSPADIVK